MPFSCVLAFGAILSRSGSKYHLVQFRLLKPSSFVRPSTMYIVPAYSAILFCPGSKYHLVQFRLFVKAI